ncbi:MAG: 30S ribosomal protein S8 [Candidatus Saccharibacteria bacterium]
MMTTDPIADMLTRIRNGLHSGKETVLVPSSKIKLSIAQILLNAGYISEVKEVKQDNFAYIALKLNQSKKPITKLQRVSKPGRRMYTPKTEIPSVLGGRGIVILSTPAGVLTGSDARKKGVGGELICKVW